MNESNFKVWLLGLWDKIKALPWKRIGLVSLCVFLALVLTGMLAVTAVIQNINFNFLNFGKCGILHCKCYRDCFVRCNL